VAFTAEQLEADARNIVLTMGLRPDWPNLGFISLAHSYGFSSLVLPLLLHGIPLFLGASPLPEALRQLASLAPAITLPAVPALWRAWHQAGVVPPHTRLAISVGAPLPLELEAQIFESSGLKVHNFYGATECGGIAYDASNLPRQDSECVGSEMSGVSVRLGDTGCLEIRGPSVGARYWPEPDPTVHDGVYRTSDLGELRDGLIFLRGRLSDAMNVAGRKVAPQSIERVLARHPAVIECLVFGVPSTLADRGEAVVACVAASRPVDQAELRGFLLDHLPAWQVPREWWFVDAITPNQRGKLSRAQWRERFLQVRVD